jgi:hypothetical protein
MYFSTTQGYTYVSSPYTLGSTLTISYYSSYTDSLILTIIDTITSKDTFTNYETYVQYSTITRIIAPSPSPINKCTCVFQLYNKIDLVLLTINNIV